MRERIERAYLVSRSLMNSNTNANAMNLTLGMNDIDNFYLSRDEDEEYQNGYIGVEDMQRRKMIRNTLYEPFKWKIVKRASGVWMEKWLYVEEEEATGRKVWRVITGSIRTAGKSSAVAGEEEEIQPRELGQEYKGWVEQEVSVI